MSRRWGGGCGMMGARGLCANKESVHEHFVQKWGCVAAGFVAGGV